MPVQPGVRLGPYEILSLLGAGGMGEVYKARDTRLDRVVAVKVLPHALADDPQFRERFDREARTISQLTHPHICTLYDIGEAPDPTVSATSHQPPATVRFLVLELLEGETLESRLTQGALPLDQSLTIGIHVASALDAAHRAGVVHRDLKPGNVMLTKSGAGSTSSPQAKLLDFGLAKANVPAVAVSGSVAPTTPPNITAQGTILGTFQYMAPEQIEGLEADARTDIFAFGCLFFEMLTGTKAFEGKTRARLIGAILKDEPPPVSQLQPLAPPALTRLVTTCLAKEPDDRWQTARDLMRELQWIEDQGAAAAVATQTADASARGAARPRRPVWTIATAAIAGVLLSAAATWILMRPAPLAPMVPTRFAIVPPASQPLSFQGVDRDIAISPDGTTIVYRAGIAQWQFFVRRIDQLDAQPLDSPAQPRTPFFSPDGRWLGFSQNNELKKISITGGPAITLCRLTGNNPRGASWGEDNVIVFATADPTTGLMTVPAGGGDPKVLTTPDATQHETDHLFPFVLPGGRGVLFTITSPGQIESSSQVAVFDSKTGQRKTLVRGGSDAQYVESGHLVYTTAGTLRAVRFDLARLEVTSDPFPVVEHVQTFPGGTANYAISRNGTLIYVAGGGGQTATRSLVWVDRSGREEPINAPLRAYAAPRLSPDGAQIALEIRDQEGDIWVWSVAHQTLTRLTFDPGFDQSPVWTRDGKHIIFSSPRAGGATNLYWHAADGTGSDERLTTGANPQGANAITPDGSRVLGYETFPQTGLDIVSWPLAPPGGRPREAERLIQTTFVEVLPDISSDGRYIAYQSNESGPMEIYVRPFPRVDAGRWQISTGGGSRPAWARSGGELFYLDASGALTSVAVQTTGSTFTSGNPTRLFSTRYATPANPRPYDVSADGQRFLMIKDNTTTDDKATPASLTVVEHWFDELRQKVSGR